MSTNDRDTSNEDVNEIDLDGLDAAALGTPDPEPTPSADGASSTPDAPSEGGGIAAVDAESLPPGGMKVGDNLYIRMVRASELREQDINAQMMDPTKFERLVENVRQRGALESMPYVHQPNGEGLISIISGHHRAMAAREAGLTSFPVLVDTSEMNRSLVRAKQIAHNELTGTPDEEILRRMIAEIDNVDDLLMTGLPDDYFPDDEELGGAPLSLPHAEFDWRMTTLLFLPEQMERLEELADLMPPETDMIGVAGYDSFDSFSQALVEYSQIMNVKNMAAVVDSLTTLALEQVKAEKERQADDAPDA